MSKTPSNPKNDNLSYLPVPAQKADLISLTPEQVDSFSRLNIYHQGVAQSAENMIELCVKSGIELLQLKASIGHGTFLKARELHAPNINTRTAQRYMATAAALAEKSPMIAQLIQDASLLGQGGNDPQLKKEILTVAHQETTGGTLTDLMRGLGVLRDAKAQEHHPRKEVTPLQEEEARRQHANEVLAEYIATCKCLIDYAEPGDRNLIDQAMVDGLLATKFLRGLGQSKKKKQPKPTRAGSRAQAKAAQAKAAQAEAPRRAALTSDQRAQISADARARWAKAKDPFSAIPGQSLEPVGTPADHRAFAKTLAAKHSKKQEAK